MRCHLNKRYHIGAIAATMGLLYWPLESLVHTYLFHEGTFLQQFFQPDPNEFWMRIIIISLFLGFGFYVEKLFLKQQQLSRIIRQQKDEIQLTVDCAFDALICINDSGQIIDCNNKTMSMLNYSREELIGSDFMTLLSTAQDVTANFQELLKRAGADEVKAFELILLLKGGTELVVEVGLSSIRREEGVAVNAFIRDVSERKRFEQRLHLADKVMQGALEGIIITDKDNVILAVNPSFSQTTGFSEQDVVGMTPRLFQSGRQDEQFYSELWVKLLGTGKWQGEVWNKRKNGELFLEWLNISAVKDEEGNATHYVATFQDITKQKENEERLIFLSHHDQLTGLPNRVLFFDRLHQSIAAAHRRSKLLALLFVDLDGFKAVNDGLGHQAGDDVLKEVSSRLQHTVRAMDTIARVGGDEFTGILAEVGSPADAVLVAEKIIAAVASPFDVEEELVHIGASIGISLYPLDSTDQEDLIQLADTAMYKAKDAGRNCFCFHGDWLGARD